MQTSTIVGAIFILAAITLSLSAPWLTRKSIWEVRGIALGGGRRLSQRGRRLTMIHLEIVAVLVAMIGILVIPLPIPTSLAGPFTIVGDLLFVFNLVFGFAVTSPALRSGAAFIDPSETLEQRVRRRAPHIM